jgi:hypothetical protein
MEQFASARSSIPLSLRPKWAALQKHTGQTGRRYLCKRFAVGFACGKRLNIEAVSLYLDCTNRCVNEDRVVPRTVLRMPVGMRIRKAINTSIGSSNLNLVATERTVAQIAYTNETQLVGDSSANMLIPGYRWLRWTRA